MSRRAKHEAEHLYQELLIYAEKLVGNQITGSKLLDRVAFAVIPGYQGTYARTQGLKKLRQLKSRQCLVINTTDAPGEHWCAAYRFPKGTLFYDSFGRSFQELFGRKPKGLWNTEDDAEQLIKEYNCGARVLAWLLVCIHGGQKAAENI